MLTPKTLKDDEAQAAFRAHDADAAVVVAYGLILPKPILDAPPLGCFNLHASLLPRWRGAAPINRAIMAGDAESGVRVMQMEEGLDTGADRHGRARADRRRHDGRRTARRAGAARRRPDGARARRAGARRACSSRRSRTRASPTPPKIDKSETRIDWAKPWKQVHDHIRGLSPFPGAWFELERRGASRCCARRVARARARPARCSTTGSPIACGDGAVRLIEVQRAGKQPMKAEEFLRGTPVAAGTCCGDADHAALQAHHRI